MATDRHPHNDIIEQLGAKTLRAHFKLSHQRLHAWRKRGIPHTHRAAVAQMAMLNGKALPAEFLSPPEEIAA